jgi:hypothetical protein
VTGLVVAAQTGPALDFGADFLGTLAVGTALVVLSAVVSGAAAAAHRWYAGSAIPTGLAVLLGTSAVALSLNATAVLAQFSGGADLDTTAVLTNVVVFGAAAFAAGVGGRSGDRIAVGLFSDTPDVARIVRSAGRLTPVDLPEEIEDMPEYDPVPPETKAALAGETLRLPRHLDAEGLREALVGRLKADYGVGHVDLELDLENREVSYLAVGSRLAGLGPTLPPGTAAVAVRADPALSASAGDAVQLFRDGERVVSGELRGTAGDTVTVALDATEAATLDEGPYRLATLPASPAADREFAALLRTVDETLGVVTVAEGSELAGVTVGALAPAVVAVRGGGETVEAIPPRSRAFAPGDVVYAVGRPDALRRLEAAAAGDGVVPLAEPTDTAADD